MITGIISKQLRFNFLQQKTDIFRLGEMEMADTTDSPTVQAPVKKTAKKKAKKSTPRPRKAEKAAIPIEKPVKCKTEDMGPILADLTKLRGNAEQVADRIQAQMIGRIDGIVAKLKILDQNGNTKKTVRKIRNRMDDLKIKPEKGRTKDVQRISRVLDRLEKLSKDGKK
jgi:hypothetical protein